MSLAELLHLSGHLTINGKTYAANWEDVIEGVRLGEPGAHGTVYLCEFENNLMAVKSIQCNGANELRIAENDLRTIRLSHPNIVKYYGFFIVENCLKICMENMAGCFHQFLQTTGLPIPENVVGVVSVGVVKALDFLKTNNIMHRDIKPSNILMSMSGIAKLCDFGISRELVQSRAHTRDAGCLLYMAPERFTGSGSYGIKSDVWSFGITLVELATGQYPYPGKEYDIMVAITEKDAPRLNPSNFSQQFCDLVERCLQKDPDRRPTFRDLLNDPFIQQYSGNTDAEEWVADVLSK